ncbi:hypothetical protein [Micromonospora tarensis]|uniref:Uncharacterized protein n=1 Tax=Micromonospora tarensis TaxID=2806100 RepID=A0ABS1YD74_9ACTN|nr:hypothetical protein [Micromonospora tarensis]MBM0275308.1 hypothetical protein [Micromonospora tarensis]
MPSRPGPRHHYFVAFRTGNSVGNTEVFLAQPIRGLVDITEIQNVLRRSMPGAVITGWQRFESA